MQKETTIIFKFDKNTPFQKEIENITNDEKFHQKNLILDVTNIEVTLDEVASLLPLYEQYTEKYNRSLVLLIEQFSYEELPEELPSAPTLQEALDIIELEDIQRDLGF